MEYERPTNIPIPTDAGQIDDDARNFLPQDDWLWLDTERYRLDFKEPYKPPKFTLSWKGIPFAPLGGLHNITGQSGNGKTMTIAQFMAAILKGECGQLRYELSDDIPNPRVLYIDTEMEPDNTIAVKNRVLTMAGREIGKEYDDFIIIMLRDIEDMPILDAKGQPTVDKKGRKLTVNPAIVRWRMTLKAIYEYKPTAVFIDGLLDVVADFNDNIECQELIFKCMKLAIHYNISLWCILHQNPGGEKLVGHLGSFLERKVTDVIQTKKIKDEKTGDVTFQVKQKKARSQDFSDWSFRVLPVDGWGRPEQLESDPAPTITGAQRDTINGDDINDVEKWFYDAKDTMEWPATRKDIKERIIAPHQSNKQRQQIDLQMLLNKRILIECQLKQNGYYLLIPNDDETQEVLPEPPKGNVPF